MLYDDLEGWNWGVDVGGRFEKKGIEVCLWLIHVIVQQKPIQHCKAINLQLKINFKKLKIKEYGTNRHFCGIWGNLRLFPAHSPPSTEAWTDFITRLIMLLFLAHIPALILVTLYLLVTHLPPSLACRYLEGNSCFLSLGLNFPIFKQGKIISKAISCFFCLYFF